jgi:hypothetical protein
VIEVFSRYGLVQEVAANFHSERITGKLEVVLSQANLRGVISHQPDLAEDSPQLLIGSVLQSI